MQKSFLGYHSEWNMGSPGGWDYQRMAQEIGKFSWERIQKASGININLDFDNPILNPVPLFAKTLLKSHKRNFGRNKPLIVLVAEKETLDKVGENIRFVKYLNSLPNIEAALTSPERLELRNGGIYLQNKKITTIFQDFNNDIIVELKKKNKLDGLITAIKQGIVVNPRGMEPIGAKGVFEAVTDEFRSKMSKTTVERTPWSRQFYQRRTKGPDGNEIPDLIRWAKDNWQNVIIKPVHGHSGKGIIIGFKESDIDKSIQHALDKGNYLIQKLVPPEQWAEEFPWFDKENNTLTIKSRQTDFRCFITDTGPIGFVTRFGGIPTNVGSGGGIQSTAILKTNTPLTETIKILNDTILNLGIDFISELQNKIDKKSQEIGNIYLLGPIKCTLRPRILTPAYIKQIHAYAQNLWNDALLLERLWIAGRLAKYVQINEEEEEIAKLAPWRGTQAIIASDGLFKFN